MPQPMTTARAWLGRSLIALDPPLFGLVRGTDLFRQLVPALPVADLCPQLPGDRLRLLLDRRPELVQPAAHEVAVDLQLLHRGPELLDVQLQRPVHAPVGGR